MVLAFVEEVTKIKLPDKRAFLVLGNEGSGTKMLTESLVAAGCYWEQDFENIKNKMNLSEKPSPLVIHRSYPHSGIHFSINEEVAKIEKGGFLTTILFILRDENARIQSVLRRDVDRCLGEVDTDSDLLLEELGEFLHYSWSQSEIFTLSYENFISSEGFRRWLFEERLGLPFPEGFEVYDGNAKYYS